MSNWRSKKGILPSPSKKEFGKKNLPNFFVLLAPSLSIAFLKNYFI